MIAEKLHWMRVHPPLEPLRVIGNTCACLDVVYEFGSRGGAYLIRRTDDRTGRVDETPLVYRKLAEERWVALLRGKVI